MGQWHVLTAAATTILANREKASIIEKTIRKYVPAASKMINLGSIDQQTHYETAKNIKTALEFPRYFLIL